MHLDTQLGPGIDRASQRRPKTTLCNVYALVEFHLEKFSDHILCILQNGMFIMPLLLTCQVNSHHCNII